MEWPTLKWRVPKEMAPARGEAEAMGDVSQWDSDTPDNALTRKQFPLTLKGDGLPTYPMVSADRRDLKTRPPKMPMPPAIIFR